MPLACRISKLSDCVQKLNSSPSLSWQDDDGALFPNRLRLLLLLLLVRRPEQQQSSTPRIRAHCLCFHSFLLVFPFVCALQNCRCCFAGVYGSGGSKSCAHHSCPTTPRKWQQTGSNGNVAAILKWQANELTSLQLITTITVHDTGTKRGR